MRIPDPGLEEAHLRELLLLHHALLSASKMKALRLRPDRPSRDPKVLVSVSVLQGASVVFPDLTGISRVLVSNLLV